MSSSLTYRDVIWWMMEAPNDLAKKYNFITFIILSNHGIQQKFLQINKTDFKVYRSMSVHFYKILRVDISGLQMMKNFFHKHRLHFLLIFEYAFICFTFLHLFLQLLKLWCFRFHMCLLSSVTFWYHLFLKDHVWFLYCSLKVGKSNVFSFVGWQSLLGK